MSAKCKRVYLYLMYPMAHFFFLSCHSFFECNRFHSLFCFQWDPVRDGDVPRVLLWHDATHQEYFIKISPDTKSSSDEVGGKDSSK